MQGCRCRSNSRPEADGLGDLLRLPEQHLHDIAIEREQRQSQHGYATPADARAFLQMARQPRAASAPAINPVAAAYFRAAEEDPRIASERTSIAAPEDAPHHDSPGGSARGGDDTRTSIDAVTDLLAEAGVLPERPLALLAAADEDPRTARLPILKGLMEFLLHHDETAYFTRSRELAFLGNALLAGCSVKSRPFTPQEASDAAACICNLGLECWPTRWPAATVPRPSSPQGVDAAMLPDGFLVDRDLVMAFEVGWSVLYGDVSAYVVDRLVPSLADLQYVDTDTRRGLSVLRRKLVEQRTAGTPWLARDAVDVLAMLDMTAWTGVLGLLDECPVLPAAVTAVLEGRHAFSPTEFEFISTTAQIDAVHRFISKLPGLLSP